MAAPVCITGGRCYQEIALNDQQVGPTSRA